MGPEYSVVDTAWVDATEKECAAKVYAVHVTSAIRNNQSLFSLLVDKKARGRQTCRSGFHG